MTFLEKINTIERLDQLIRMRATGDPNTLAERLGISRRSLFYIIGIMKSMEAPIKFCNQRQSYYYEYDCKLAIGFLKKSKIVGGLNIKNNENMMSAYFMHPTNLFLR